MALSLASSTGAIEPLPVTLAIIIVSNFAFIVSSSSNLIGMLYRDEYNNGTVIFKYRSVFAVIGVVCCAGRISTLMLAVVLN